MSTNSITECAVAIYLEGADLRELGLHVPVSTADARTLIVNAMRTSGRQPWGQMEVEMFTYDDSVLLLARPSDRAATCFGHPYRCSAGQAAHMAEHGKVLMANRAAFLLNRYFHK